MFKFEDFCVYLVLSLTTFAAMLLLLVLVVPKDYSEDNIEALAKNIYFEARNSTIDDQIATAVVVLNRGEPRVEVYKKNQFSWTSEYKEPADNLAYKKAKAIARMVYNNQEVFRRRDICKHYLSASMSKRPDWTKTFKRHTTVGKHTYYCP